MTECLHPETEYVEQHDDEACLTCGEWSIPPCGEADEDCIYCLDRPERWDFTR